jgi:hypothetical protein
MKNLFLHILDLTIPKKFILFASCGAEVTCRDFRLTDQIPNSRSGKVPLDSDCLQGKTNSFNWKTDLT